MRMRLMAVVIVLAVSVSVCVLDTHIMFSTLDEMNDLCAAVLRRAESGDMEGAREALAQMALCWEKRLPYLETFLAHSNLHEVGTHYAESATDLESRDMESFAHSVTLLKESLDHLRDQESMSWSNVL